MTRGLRIALLVATLAMIGAGVATAFLSFSLLGGIVGQLLLIMIFLGVALACSAVRDRGIMPRRMLSGVVVSLGVVGGHVAVIVTQRLLYDAELLIVAWWIGTTWSMLMALTGLLALPAPRVRWWQALRRTTVVILYVVAALYMIGVWLHPEVTPFWALLGFSHGHDAAEFLGRGAAALTLLAGGFVAATFLTMWATPPLVGETKQLLLWLRCPRCGTEQNRRTGDGRCDRCGLRIRVQVQ